MLVPDVNVLVYAHREDSLPDPSPYARWLTDLATGREPFALSVLALAGLVRIVTNPQVFRTPSSLEQAWEFVGELVKRPQARIISPGPDHLNIFEELCRQAAVTGKLVADAQHAAVAIEHRCTLITTDVDFDRFPSLRWQHPLRNSRR